MAGIAWDNFCCCFPLGFPVDNFEFPIQCGCIWNLQLLKLCEFPVNCMLFKDYILFVILAGDIPVYSWCIYIMVFIHDIHDLHHFNFIQMYIIIYIWCIYMNYHPYSPLWLSWCLVTKLIFIMIINCHRTWNPSRSSSQLPMIIG
jgi:hypothetical protein